MLILITTFVSSSATTVLLISHMRMSLPEHALHFVQRIKEPLEIGRIGNA